MPAPPATSADLNADNDIDLGSLPEIENPAVAGPQTSAIRKRTPAAEASEDVVGQPMAPTTPASGWLGSGTNLGPPPAPALPLAPTDPASGWLGSGVNLDKPAMPSIPSLGNIASTWAELDLPAAKAAPVEPPKAPVEPPKAEHRDSWHPSSGNVGVPSMANIDLPPDEGGPGSDVFSKANRPGLAPGAFKPEPVKIAKPKPVELPKAEAKPPSEAALAVDPVALAAVHGLHAERAGRAAEGELAPVVGERGPAVGRGDRPAADGPVGRVRGSEETKPRARPDAGDAGPAAAENAGQAGDPRRALAPGHQHPDPARGADADEGRHRLAGRTRPAAEGPDAADEGGHSARAGRPDAVLGRL